MMSGLSCSIQMRVILRLSLHVYILIIDDIRFFSQKLGESLDDCLLGFSLLSVIYVLVVLLHTLIMSVLSNCYMHLMITYGA
jgi:hypothetical protein